MIWSIQKTPGASIVKHSDKGTFKTVLDVIPPGTATLAAPYSTYKINNDIDVDYENDLREFLKSNRIKE